MDHESTRISDWKSGGFINIISTESFIEILQGVFDFDKLGAGHNSRIDYSMDGNNHR